MSEHVPLELQQEVLNFRRGSILHRNTILKSYHIPSSRNYIQVEGLLIYTIGSPTLVQLQNVLEELGCGPGSNKLAIISDITEEVTIFIKVGAHGTLLFGFKRKDKTLAIVIV